MLRDAESYDFPMLVQVAVARELPPYKGFMGMCCPRRYGFGQKKIDSDNFDIK